MVGASSYFVGLVFSGDIGGQSRAIRVCGFWRRIRPKASYGIFTLGKLMHNRFANAGTEGRRKTRVLTVAL